MRALAKNIEDNLPHVCLDCWSPNFNIARDPLWDRILETTGEDPFLTGVFGGEYTKGLQRNEDIDSGYLQAIATLKHYAGCSLESYGDTSRHNFNAIVSNYDAATTFFPAWIRSVKLCQAKSVMCSYNEFNGVPSCGSKYLLNDVLREVWGFGGYVSSDYGAVEDIYANNRHSFVPTGEESWPSKLLAMLIPA